MACSYLHLEGTSCCPVPVHWHSQTWAQRWEQTFSRQGLALQFCLLDSIPLFWIPSLPPDFIPPFWIASLLDSHPSILDSIPPFWIPSPSPAFHPSGALQDQPLAGSSLLLRTCNPLCFELGGALGLISSHPTSTGPGIPCAGQCQPEEPAHQLITKKCLFSVLKS